MKNLKSGDILICRGHRLISKTIMKVTKSEWSHAALYFEVINPDGSVTPSIIEAQKNGVNLKTYSEWINQWGYEYIVYRNKTIFNETELFNRALSKCGETGYDFTSFLIKQPWKLMTGRWRNIGDREDDKMICSEVCAWVWKLNGWYKMTPDDLNVYLKGSSSWVHIPQ